MNEIVKNARENILSDDYGKFDLIEKLIPAIELLDNRPRVIKKKICHLLNIYQKDFPYPAFYKWLTRYRQNLAGQNANSKIKPANDLTLTANNDADWLSHVPAPPYQDKSKTSSLIKSI